MKKICNHNVVNNEQVLNMASLRTYTQDIIYKTNCEKGVLESKAVFLYRSYMVQVQSKKN